MRRGAAETERAGRTNNVAAAAHTCARTSPNSSLPPTMTHSTLFAALLCGGLGTHALLCRSDSGKTARGGSIRVSLPRFLTASERAG